MERLDRFMARANDTYYASHDPFADFTTAPEISQVFGELVGLWCAVVWTMIGQPSPVSLVEFGPGRGTLLADAWRAIAQRMPDFAKACRIHLVETSPRLQAILADRFPSAAFHDDEASLPDGPMLVVCNEFFDALPIRQAVRRGDAWTERFVVDGAFVEAPTDLAPSIAAAEGDVVEVGEMAGCLCRRLASRIVRHGGAALFLDYGPADSSVGDSLQAIRGRNAADPLAEPGTADLTTHVDFAALADAAREAGATVHGPIPQGMFLARLGLFQRTASLTESLDPVRATALTRGARRLAEPDGMGRLFKAIAICQADLPILPGFECD
jgi:SAM-dependent MidA family methyltransferase